MPNGPSNLAPDLFCSIVNISFILKLWWFLANILKDLDVVHPFFKARMLPCTWLLFESFPSVGLAVTQLEITKSGEEAFRNIKTTEVDYLDKKSLYVWAELTIACALGIEVL